jgi:hypothetical protein
MPHINFEAYLACALWLFYWRQKFPVCKITIEKHPLGAIGIQLQGRSNWKGIERETIGHNADERICPECTWNDAWRRHGDCWPGQVRYLHSWGTWRDTPRTSPGTNRRFPTGVSLETRETCWGKTRESRPRAWIHINSITNVNSRVVMYLIRRGSIGALSVYAVVDVSKFSLDRGSSDTKPVGEVNMTLRSR